MADVPTLCRMRAGKDTIVVVDDETGAVTRFAQWERPHPRLEAGGDEVGSEELDPLALAPEDTIPVSLDRESLKSLGTYWSLRRRRHSGQMGIGICGVCSVDCFVDLCELT